VLGNNLSIVKTLLEAIKKFQPNLVNESDGFNQTPLDMAHKNRKKKGGKGLLKCCVSMGLKGMDNWGAFLFLA
jgi:hypothetical protein